MTLDFFAEMAWKSALISGATLALAYALRSRAAADRALVLRIGVGMLLLLPLIAIWLPALEIVAFAAPDPLATAPYDIPPELQLAGAMGAAPEPTIWDDPTPLVILAYLGGLAMVGSRLLAGLWTLHRWTRTADEVTCPEWLAAFERVRWSVSDSDSVRLLVSNEVNSPLSWGWRQPVVLIDTDTLGQPDDAEAILAHELAHVARRDWPALMLSRIAATLFWFNPLVWMLERETVQQAEEAADCEAAGRVEPARYAETLLNWAQSNPLLPANSIAPSGHALGRRVRAVLDRSVRERPSGSAWTAAAILLCFGIAAPVAAMRLVAAPPPEALEEAEAPAEGVRAVPLPPSVSETSAPPAAAEAPEPPQVHDAGEIHVTVPEIPDVGPQVEAALAAATIDSETIEEALREARTEMRRASLSRAEMSRAMREARRQQARARADSHRQMRLAMREAKRAIRTVPRIVSASMAHGAVGMMSGAESMESSARSMEEEASRLEDPHYRERAIARARARGETVTHEDLREAAEGLRDGAQGMREGAQEMREAAREMRERHN
ncbi:M56 family metallopeptidase [Sphingosinicella sp. CPCC 101087]|uniref:M56 family metallopeptidase n=1 Tax=Sphingosinicella sp. CPCC 101087 TaxID=2497754 RepID=UPI0013EDA044|nr:M56 family metallopeptidase [Sphingosinicella sp. CPCC 101087]